MPLIVEDVLIDSIYEDPENVRVHDDRNLSAIKSSLEQFGQVEALVVLGDTGKILGGNGRHVVMKELGWETVTIHRFEGSEEDGKALAIALNRTAELAGWDYEKLNAQLGELSSWGDTSDIGWNTAERAVMPLPEPEAVLVDPEPQIDKAAELQKKWKTETGQLWEIKSPRWVYCPKCNKLHRVPE